MRKSAEAIIKRMLKKSRIRPRVEEEVNRLKKPLRDGIEEKARQTTPVLPVDQRQRNFNEVKTGFSEEMAMSEVQRCMTCFQCELYCLYHTIDVHPFKEVLPLAIEYPAGGRKHGQARRCR